MGGAWVPKISPQNPICPRHHTVIRAVGTQRELENWWIKNYILNGFCKHLMQIICTLIPNWRFKSCSRHAYYLRKAITNTDSMINPLVTAFQLTINISFVWALTSAIRCSNTHITLHANASKGFLSVITRPRKRHWHVIITPADFALAQHKFMILWTT